MSRRYEITALAYDKRGKLLAVGRNSYTKTHPLQAKFGKKGGKPAAVYIHAELAALLKARQKVYKIVVIRYNKEGKPACAKPCPSCQLALKYFGVKKIEHT